MHKIKFLIILVFSFFMIVKGDSLYVSPSVFYTYGGYNNSTISRSYSAYSTFQLSNKIYTTIGYDNLTLENNDWKYPQQMLVVGAIDYEFPFYIKMNYAHIKGDFHGKSFTYEISDYTNIYNADISYFLDWYYLGISATYLNMIGFQNEIKSQTSTQITLRIEKTLSPEAFISFKPNFSSLLDGRKLYSAALRLNYLITPELLIKVGGFLGERAYYFDSDLLTIYNQDFTQYNQFFVQADYNITPRLKTIIQYQRTKFSAYSINYYVAGLNYYFWL